MTLSPVSHFQAVSNETTHMNDNNDIEELSSAFLSKFPEVLHQGLNSLKDCVAMIAERIEDCVFGITDFPSFKAASLIEHSDGRSIFQVPVMPERFSSFERVTNDLLPMIGSFLAELEVIKLSFVSKRFWVIAKDSFYRQIRQTTVMQKNTFAHYYRVIRILSSPQSLLKISSQGLVEKRPIELSYHALFKILNPELEKLSLAHLPVTDNDILELATRCSGLQKLDLSRCLELTNKTLEILGSQFKELQCVSFFGCTKMTPDAVRTFAEKAASIQHHLLDEKSDRIAEIFETEINCLKLLQTPGTISSAIRYAEAFSSEGVYKAREKLGMMIPVVAVSAK